MAVTLEGHTVHRYDGELNHLHLHVLEMAGLVLNQTQLALQALKKKDTQLARQIIEREHDVDKLELELDSEILSVIARRSPVARDLRVLMSFSKTVTDLERIGDEAARIANLTVSLYDNDRSDPSTHLLRDIYTIGNIANDLLVSATDTLDTLDASQAKIIILNHFELDAEFQSSLRRLTTFLLEDARNVGHTISIVQIIKALERIGDHARNLAEYVIFLVEGDDVRHPASRERETKE